jgi:hypothetical protein
MKAKLPERQSEGVNAPSITEGSYKRYTANRNEIIVGSFSITQVINCVSFVKWSKADQSQ